MMLAASGGPETAGRWGVEWVCDIEVKRPLALWGGLVTRAAVAYRRNPE